jgi:Short C-terminal domain
MGLLRGMARTAVVAGTATAVSNRVSRRQAGRWQGEADQEAAAQQQQQQQEAPPPQYAADPAAAPAQYAAPPPPPAPDPIAELQQLAQLKDQGILTEEEFTAKKKQVLGI